MYREIPQLIERGVDVQADSTGMADPASAADNQTDLGLWWLIIIFSLLIITGGIAYYFVLLRRVVKKGFLKQKVKGNQPTTNRQSIDKKRTTGS